jgi:hypothetical protein
MPVMIVSYETLRTLQDELANCPIGLLLADEGHRLKNAGKQLRFLEYVDKADEQIPSHFKLLPN